MHLQQHGRALATDLYELTMAAAYFDLGVTRRAAFELFVRSLPAQRSYLLCAGLEQAVSYLLHLSFSGEQIDYLRGLPVFERTSGAFFDYLAGFRFTGSLDAVPEGEPVFADEPLLRVEAPIIEAQFAETFLLSMVNYQTLVASKAARVVEAACADGRDRAVVDFGARRAHGPDAGVLAARAACVGGCAATSNVEAGFQTGMALSGTEAHSFIMAFEREEDAFRGYYECFGEHAILLIDTYDVIEGARRAAAVAPKMRGVRIDSGDIAALSRQVRRVLDEAGLKDAMIFASGDLDEGRIADIVAAGAPVDGFGVGTRLVTSEDAASLGGVYKLVAVRGGRPLAGPAEAQRGQGHLPGPQAGLPLQRAAAPLPTTCLPRPTRPPRRRRAPAAPVMRDGKLAADLPDLPDIARFARVQLGRLPARHRRLHDAKPYPVRVSERLRRDFDSLARQVKEDNL